jgi:hypothetical protein
MRQSSLFALFGATVIAVVIAVLVSLGGSTAANDPRINQPVLADLPKRLDQIARLTVIHGDAKTTLLRDQSGWIVEQKDDYPADAGKIRQILLGLAALRYAEPKTAKPALYSRLDLDDPDKKGSDAQLITLSDAKRQLMGEIIVGKRRYDIFGGGNDGIYVRKPGEVQSWLADGSLTLPTGTLDWLDREITMIKADRIAAARFVAPDNAVVVIARDKPGAPFALAGGVPKGQKLKSADALTDLARALDYFSLDDVAPAMTVPFPDKGISQAVYTTFDGLSLTVSMIERDEIAKDNGKDVTKKKYWVKILAIGTGKAAPEASALNRRLLPWAFAVPEFKATNFKTRIGDLLEPEKNS